MTDNDPDEITSSKVSELFMELASETRYCLLLRLKDKPSKLSTLAKLHGTTVQDVFRNLNRLTTEGLVKKGADGLFYISEYGLMVLNQIPYFIFLKKHKKFFEGHSLEKSNIPVKFLRRIGELYRCERVDSVTAVLQRLKKLESSANQFIKAVVSQAWPEEGIIFIDRAKHGIEVTTIAGHNMIFPKNVVNDIVPSIRDLVSEGIFKTRMLDDVRVAIYIADKKEAGIMFPDTDGEVDMTTLFVSKDPEFCEWSTDLFEYFYQKSKPLDIGKMRVVE
jgi:predicted transcriptional regulator